MNFEKYNLWEFKNYGNLYLKIDKLKKSKNKITFVLKDKHNKIIDKIVIPENELTLQDNKNIIKNYNRYSTNIDENIVKEIKELTEQLMTIQKDFDNNIFNVFCKDISKELDIKFDKIENLILLVCKKADLTLINIDADDVENLNLFENDNYFAKKKLYSSLAERIFKLVEFEISIFKILKNIC